jgi:hypothetical protein
MDTARDKPSVPSPDDLGMTPEEVALGLAYVVRFDRKRWSPGSQKPVPPGPAPGARRRTGRSTRRHARP